MGRKRTKKYVELSVCIKRKTGSVDTVRWLNCFGLSITYDEINALETKLAEEQVNNQTDTSLVPNHIQPSVFVTFCFDNCDHNMESIYNATLYRTNDIIIQQLDKQQAEATGTNSTIVSTERRSFEDIYHELQPYIKQKKGKTQHQSNKWTPAQTNWIGCFPDNKISYGCYFDDIPTKIIRLYLGGRVSFMKSPNKPLTPILLVTCLLYTSHQQRWMLF